jgi:hypothetical protein
MKTDVCHRSDLLLNRRGKILALQNYAIKMKKNESEDGEGWEINLSLFCTTISMSGDFWPEGDQSARMLLRSIWPNMGPLIITLDSSSLTLFPSSEDESLASVFLPFL